MDRRSAEESDGENQEEKRSKSQAVDLIRQSGRARRASDRYGSVKVMAGLDYDNTTLRKAFQREYKAEWQKAIKSKFDSLKEKGSWSIVSREEAKGKRIILSKLIYKIKRNSD